MVDQTKLIDLSGDTILCTDVQTGVSSPIGAQGGSSLPGFSVVGVQDQIKVVLRSVNFNAGTTDTSFVVPLPSGTTRWNLQQLLICNASQTLTTATIGVFTGAGGTGTTLLADGAITVATATQGNANSAQSRTGVLTVDTTATTAFVRIGTPQGAAATGDVTLQLNLLS